MRVAIVGRVSARDLDLADLFGIGPIDSFVTNENSAPPLLDPPRACDVIPLERMIGDPDVATRQNDYRLLLYSDALVIQGDAGGYRDHIVGIAHSYGHPVMELP